MPLFSKLISAFLLLFLTGCQTTINNGQKVSQQNLMIINSEHPSKEELVSMIGSPTYVPDYSPNTWYYIQRTAIKSSPFPREVKEQEILMVTFNENNVLEARIVDDIVANDNITVNTECTESYGSDKSGIQKFIGNIGKFRSPSKNKKR